MILSILERMVQQEIMDKGGFPSRLFFGAIGVGIMIFIIVIAGIVAINAVPGVGTVAAPAIPFLQG
jgi:hypothetical protein